MQVTEEQITLQQKVIDIVNGFDEYELKIYVYMCEYLMPYFPDSTEVEQWATTLDLAGSITTICRELNTLTPERFEAKKYHETILWALSYNYVLEELVHRIEVVFDAKEVATLPDDIQRYAFALCLLPVLEPLNES